jgi:hypothetical protein
VGGEEIINSLVKELGTVICLEGVNSDTKLRARKQIFFPRVRGQLISWATC